MRKLSGKFHFFLRFCTRKRSKTYAKFCKASCASELPLKHISSLHNFLCFHSTFFLIIWMTSQVVQTPRNSTACCIVPCVLESLNFTCKCVRNLFQWSFLSSINPNGLFGLFRSTLTETDSGMDLDSDFKSDSHIVLCRICSHCTDSDSDPYSLFLQESESESIPRRSPAM